MERAPRPVPATRRTSPAASDPSVDDRSARLAALAARRATPPSSRRSKRRHAAKGARAAALALSVASTGGLSVVFAATDHAAASPVAASALAAPVQASLTAAAPAAATPTVAKVALPNAAAPKAATHKAAVTTVAAKKPSTFTGQTDTNRWGPVQVRITVSGGRISDVTALQTPSHARRSVRINQQAAPWLRSEALTAQSADIDNISGATYTSDSYVRSLQSAIDEARAAGALAG